LSLLEEFLVGSHLHDDFVTLLLDLRFLTLANLSQKLVFETVECDAEVDDCGFVEDLCQEARVGQPSCHVEIEPLVNGYLFITQKGFLESIDHLHLLLEQTVNSTL
jgi:hypothetical protein